MHIAEYANAGYAGHDPRRPRKLLLNKVELRRLAKQLKDVGVTIIPTLLYIAPSGYAKLRISIARGKKLHDKRESLKEKDVARDMERD
jgi:SsrA-binding protein